MSAFSAWFHSYRARLQAAFLGLGLAAIGITGWEASQSAAAALRGATDERLTALRRTRGRQIERYFEDLTNHVLALSSDDSTLTALEQWRRAWLSLPAATGLGGSDVARLYAQLDPAWAPDPPAAALQYRYIAANPHPAGSKDLLLEAPGLGAYDTVHRRYHPTFHRYQTAFGFYDLFLVDLDGRVLYTVFKEIDIGARLRADPYAKTGLGRVFARALELPDPERTVVEDFSPYLPSGPADAAFVAAPVWRGGAKAGVLVIQISVHEINRLMSGDRNWSGEGFGESGQAYLIGGADGRLRSHARSDISPARATREVPPLGQIGAVTAGYPRTPDRAGEVAAGLSGHPVLRSAAPLRLPGLDWWLVAEIDTSEALAPVRVLRRRILLYALGSALLVLAAARWLANGVTRRLTKLAEVTGRLGGRDMSARVEVEGRDEIAALASSFNLMADHLQRTTVSKGEWQTLAGRLITAQEQERQRVARELHDDLTQRLAAVAIDAGRLERIGSAEGSPAAGLAARIKEQMAALSTDVHGLSRRLHPSTLDDLGLAASLEAECRSFFERGGPPVDLFISPAAEPGFGLPRERQLALYRIAQEALRNVLRHAGAGSVAVRLYPDPSGEPAVCMEIEDDGRGFTRGGEAWKPGLGLASMEERARLAGGVLIVDSRSGQGTRLKVTIPHEQGGDPHERQEAPAAAG